MKFVNLELISISLYLDLNLFFHKLKYKLKAETAFKFDLKLWTPSSLICQRSFETIYLLNMTLKMYSLSFSTNFQKKNQTAVNNYPLACTVLLFRNSTQLLTHSLTLFTYKSEKETKSWSQCRIKLSIVSTNAMNLFSNDDCTSW